MRTRQPLLYKVYNILLGPNSKIEGKRERQLASLLSAFLLALIPFAALTILTGDILGEIGLLLLVTTPLIFLLYLVSRTHYYRFTAALVVLLITFAPMAIWFSVTNWQSYDVARLMPWVIVALVVGAVFTDERVVLIQGIVISLVIIFIAVYARGIPFHEIDSHLLTVVILTVLVTVTSQTINSYMIETENQSTELENQKRELEIYTRLLRHDLSNDLQAIINTVELSKMLLSVNLEKADENLDHSLIFGLRMQKLLHVFRLPPEQPGVSLVENLRNIAVESEETHGNLTIDVSWTEEAERESITAGRLLPLVWTNIFRNASQHAGERPLVSVDISIIDHQYQVVIKDDGSGIPANVRENLFRKDSDFENQDKGIGLYLSRLIIEAHGGTIALSETPDTQFIIRIPTGSFR